MTTINVPGALETAIVGVNGAGQIFGQYSVSGPGGTVLVKGFVYYNGIYTTVAKANANFSTVAGISGNGDIYGDYDTTASATSIINIALATPYYGFRDTNGVFTDISDPAVSGTTQIAGYNDALNALYGSYSDTSGTHGFVDINGTFSTFDDTATNPSLKSTTVTGIGVNATVGTYGVGYYTTGSGTNPSAQIYHGFIYQSGFYTNFDVSGALYTFITGVTKDVFFGYYIDTNHTYHGFYDKNNVVTTVDAPNAVKYTDVGGIDAQGNLVGNYADANGQFHGYTETLAGFAKPVKSDFFGDQTSDVLWLNSSGTVLDWRLAAGQFVQSTTIGGFAPASGWTIAGTGDFNGDLTNDVLLNYTSGGQTTVAAWIVQSGTYSSYVVLGGFSATSGWRDIGVGDFNGDGTSDVLLSYTSGVNVNLWDYKVSNGATVATQNLNMGFTTTSGWIVLGTGDFNGDGTTDILFQNRTSGLVADWSVSNGAAQTFTSIAGVAPSSGWAFDGAGDFNGDGTSDILWQNGSNLAIWEIKNGAFLRSVNVSTPAPTGFTFQEVGNYMGNGTSDVLWRNSTTGAVQIWAMQDGQAQTTTSPGGAGSSWFISG